MMFRTHLLFSLFFYFLIIKIFSLNFSLVFMFLIAIGSILPDIDSPSSFVNRKYLFGIGKTVSLFSSHRGFFHSVFGLVVFFIVAFILINFLKLSLFYAVAFSLGYFLHLVADSLNVSGVKWFWKFGKIKGPIKTAGTFEQFFFFVLIVLTAFLILEKQPFQSLTAFISKIKP